MDEIQIYRSGLRGHWRWRYTAAGNHRRLANGSEGYAELSDLLDSMCRVTSIRRNAALWTVGEHHVQRVNGEPIWVVIRRG